MQQRELGHAGELVASVVVRGALGLAGNIARSHHHRALHAAQHQVVQRCVGEHKAEQIETGSHRFRQRIAPAFQQHNG